MFRLRVLWWVYLQLCKKVIFQSRGLILKENIRECCSLWYCQEVATSLTNKCTWFNGSSNMKGHWGNFPFPSSVTFLCHSLRGAHLTGNTKTVTEEKESMLSFWLPNRILKVRLEIIAVKARAFDPLCFRRERKKTFGKSNEGLTLSIGNG